MRDETPDDGTRQTPPTAEPASIQQDQAQPDRAQQDQAQQDPTRQEQAQQEPAQRHQGTWGQAQQSAYQPDQEQRFASPGSPTWGEPAAPRARRSFGWKKTVGAVAVAAVLVTGGVVGVNALASGAESSTSSQRGPGGFGGTGNGQNSFPGGGGGMGGPGGGQTGIGLSAALHGEFVVSSGSSFQTRRMQRGTITAISGDTVTITSDDGFSANYAVGDVDVSGLAVGSTVTAIGTVSGETVTLESLTATDASASGGQQGGPMSGGRDGSQGGPQGGTQDGTQGGGQDGTQAPATSGTTANA